MSEKATATTALLSLALIAGCDRFYTVSGRVSSCADKRPIPGAMVHLSNGEKGGFTKSESDGSFRTALNEPDGDGPSDLTVARVGFRTVEHHVSKPHAPQNVCLPPTPQACHIARPSMRVMSRDNGSRSSMQPRFTR